jgi:signal transduction histidine kinase
MACSDHRLQVQSDTGPAGGGVFDVGFHFCLTNKLPPRRGVGRRRAFSHRVSVYASSHRASVLPGLQVRLQTASDWTTDNTGVDLHTDVPEGGTPAALSYEHMKANLTRGEAAMGDEPGRNKRFSSNWLEEEDRGKVAEALHSIRNRLTAIFGFAELAQGGSLRAQQLLLTEITDRTDAICSQLDVIDAAVRCTRRFSTSPFNAS